MDAITLYSPLDMHVHFRQGDMLKHVAPLTAFMFSGALVMPNTVPPTTTIEQVISYKSEIEAATDGQGFQPYMTLYLQSHFDRAFLEAAKPHILSIKLYPKGMTTNSDHGVDVEDPAVLRVLALMEELSIPLCVHGEAKGYVMHRESLFLKTYDRWARDYKNLKIIMEHITSADLVRFLGWYPNIFATITTHHLLFTTDDVLGDGIQPHHYCKPIAKEPKDLEALRDLAMNKWRNPFEKVMLGTDSAPHAVDKKECACGCAGVFNAPFTLPLLAQEFMKYSDLEHLQNFVSNNAQRIYGIQPPPKKVVLRKENCIIPSRYGDVVPMWAGKEIEWKCESVA